jgi:hypothetical protein
MHAALTSHLAFPYRFILTRLPVRDSLEKSPALFIYVSHLGLLGFLDKQVLHVIGVYPMEVVTARSADPAKSGLAG